MPRNTWMFWPISFSSSGYFSRCECILTRHLNFSCLDKFNKTAKHVARTKRKERWQTSIVWLSVSLKEGSSSQRTLSIREKERRCDIVTNNTLFQSSLNEGALINHLYGGPRRRLGRWRATPPNWQRLPFRSYSRNYSCCLSKKQCYISLNNVLIGSDRFYSCYPPTRCVNISRGRWKAVNFAWVATSSACTEYGNTLIP